VIGIGAGLGPVIGGLLLAGFGWRAIFAINLPIVAVVLIVLRRTAPNGEGVAATEAAAVDERHTDGEPAEGAASKGPLITGPLITRPFAAAFSTQAMSTLAQYTLLLVTPIVLDSRGWGSSSIGVALSALTLGMIVMGPAGGHLGDEYGRRLPVMVGLTIATLAVSVAVVSGSDIASALLIALLLTFGLGLGVATPSVITAGVEAAPVGRVGLGAGLLSASRYVGSIVASVLLGVLVADDNTGVMTMFVVAAIALVVSLAAATGLPSRSPRAGQATQTPTPVK
jgi:DHA2 family methylenomycin A resistance protein-like MFS transporter